MSAVWTKEFFSVPTNDPNAPFEFLHWYDPALADAWLAEAVRRLGLIDGGMDALEMAPYEQQRAAVVGLFEALSGFYRAANLPPYSEPTWLAAAGAWLLNKPGSRMYEDAVSFWEKLTGKTLGATGNAYVGTSVELCGAQARVYLNFDGELVARCAASVFDPGSCGPAGGGDTGCANDWRNFLVNGKPTLDMIYPRCRPDGPGVSYLERYSWRTFAWRNAPTTGGGAADVECATTDISYPLRWYYGFARDVVRGLAALGTRAVVQQTRLYVIAANARSAAAAGLLDGGDASLLAAATAAENDPTKWGYQNPAIVTTAATLGAIAAIVATQAPPYGAIAGAIIAIGAALLQVIPLATGVSTDEWGRRKPVFLYSTITGSVTADGRPSHDVPNPPGFVPAAPAPSPSSTTSASAASMTPRQAAPTATAGTTGGARTAPGPAPVGTGAATLVPHAELAPALQAALAAKGTPAPPPATAAPAGVTPVPAQTSTPLVVAGVTVGALAAGAFVWWKWYRR